MNIKNYISIALLATLSAAFVACDGKEDPEYVGVSSTTGERVYFNEQTIAVNISETDPGFAFTIYRPEAMSSEEYTVKLVVTDESGLFTVPTTATFMAGMPSANVQCTSDLANIQPNTPYTINVAIDGADANEYAIADANVVVTLPAWSEWAPFIVGEETEDRNGQGAYTFSLYYSGTENPVQVLSRTNPIDTNEKEFEFQWLIDNDDPSLGWETFMTARTTDNCKTIIVPEQPFAMNANYGVVYVADTYTYSANSSYKGLTTFDAETGLFTLNLIYYCSAGSFGNGNETLQLFGYADLNDYTLTLSDKGQINVADTDYQVIGFSYDVEAVAYVDYTIVKVEDGKELTEEQIAEIANTISDPEQTTYTLETIEEPGNITLNFPSSADYTLVAVAYNADGEAKSSASVSFSYETFNPLLGWTEISSATFNSQMAVDLAAMLYEVALPLEEYEVTISQNDEHKTLYRVNQPFASCSYAPSFGEVLPFGSIEFVMGSNPNEIIFPLSDTDLTVDGDVFSVMSYAYYLEAGEKEVDPNLYGKYANGIISLPANGDMNWLFALGEDGYYALDSSFALNLNGQASEKPAKTAARNIFKTLATINSSKVGKTIYCPYFFTAKKQAKDVRSLNINPLARRF